MREMEDRQPDGWEMASILRVLRGGSWVDNPGICRSYYRSVDLPIDHYDFGFRAVRVFRASQVKGEVKRVL